MAAPILLANCKRRSVLFLASHEIKSAIWPEPDTIFLFSDYTGQFISTIQKRHPRNRITIHQYIPMVNRMVLQTIIPNNTHLS